MSKFLKIPMSCNYAFLGKFGILHLAESGVMAGCRAGSQADEKQLMKVVICEA